ncbi:hypothetical protein VNI00_016526 [Paramarasmius palmivorus]|uniref:Uncharacterized protein n=1 Tax=Paramarasmius palmivorus TaxID=297713 RepID=A0AAW0BF31_9AGAR
MQIAALVSLATTAALLTKASPAPSQLNRRKEIDVNKCRPLDKGQCTLNAIASMVVVPALDTTGFPGEADAHWVDEYNSIYVQSRG